MATSTAQYLLGLYQDNKARQEQRRGKKLTFYEDRPKCISYDDGTEIRLEHDTTHPTINTLDRVTIKTAKGVFVLNDMLQEPISIFDTGYNFDFSRTASSDDPNYPKYVIFYGSVSLETFKGNIYSLLHEFCHASIDIREGYNKGVALESAVWDETDKLIQEMGLNLFDNDEERQLYRDVHLRTYDLFNEAKSVKTGLMTLIDCFTLDPRTAQEITETSQEQIDEVEFMNEYKKLKNNITLIYGLALASCQGMSLVDLCNRLIAEKQLKQITSS